MAEISFIFTTPDGNTKFGKYITDWLSDDHDGLDTVIYYNVIDCWNLHLKSIGLEPIKKMKVGVIGLIKDDFCSKYDANGFDMFIKNNSFTTKYYINNKLLN